MQKGGIDARAGFLAVIIVLMGIVTMVINYTHTGASPNQATPQVVYIPTPATLPTAPLNKPP